MWQVLFTIPVAGGIPIYGFGLMLFFAYILSVKLASHLARREGVDPDIIQDLAIWLFVGGLLGARTTYLIFHQEIFKNRPFFEALWDFIKNLPRIWDGGIILYGSVAGGVVAYFLAYFLVFRKRGISTLQLADIIAPSAAVGVCLGRLGCLLNGCCYGQVACPSCPGVEFPLSAPARFELTEAGLQTAAGFTMDTHLATVTEVQAGHGDKGLLPGDVVLRVNQDEASSGLAAEGLLEKARLLGQVEVTIQVRRGSETLTPKLRVPSLGFKLVGPQQPRVEAVEEGSSAARAGLKVGDVIAAARVGSDEARRLRDATDLASALLRRKPLTLTVRRGGEEVVLDAFSVPGLGFAIGDVTTRVGQVAAGSAAADVGELKAGDAITAVNGQPVASFLELSRLLVEQWPRGQRELRLTVVRDGQSRELPPYEPRTVKLHPTQLYESVSMALLLLVLLAFYPLRRSRGQVMALLMIGYACHRTVNELLRNDIRPIALELTISGVVLAGGVVMFVWLWYRPVPPGTMNTGGSGSTVPAGS